jgi:hypothetical protein
MKSRFKVVSLLCVFLLLFALGGVASADVATDISVAISYPCEQGEVCDETGVAVSRSGGDFVGPGPGDVVNVYITLQDANGNPATAGPNNESLDVLEAIVTTSLGTVIIPDTFQQQISAQQTVSFSEKGGPNARCYVSYTDAQVGNGTDTINVATPGNPLSAGGSAQVNLEAPPATDLVVRTCPDVPDTLYDEIGLPCNNGDDTEVAGSSVPFSVIADQGADLFTTAPNLEGQQITVCAYADYNANGTAGDVDEEKEPLICDDFEMNGGIAQGSLPIDRAGLENSCLGFPEGLAVLLTATGTDTLDVELGTDQIDIDLDIEICLTENTDTVVMVPGDPAALMVAEDPFENGNYLMMPEDDCLSVLDDADDCGPPGTATDILVAIVDSRGNAVDPDGTVAVNGTYTDALNFQLAGCELLNIDGYAEECSLADVESSNALSIIIQSVLFQATDLDPTSVSIHLLPSNGCGVLDLSLSVDEGDVLATGPISAGDTVQLTLLSMGDIPIVTEGDDLTVTADSVNGMMLLSNDGCATTSTTLQKTNALDEDGDTPGLQTSVAVCALATNTLSEEVLFTVTDQDQCGASASTPEGEGVADVQPGDAVNLAVVDIADGLVTHSILDTTTSYTGTDPVVIDTPVLTEEVTTILDSASSCDLQWWDAFNNVVAEEPSYDCRIASGLGFLTTPDPCILNVTFPDGVAGTTQTIICAADFDDDDVADAFREFELTVVEEIGDVPDEGNPATALTIEQEGPQTQDGSVINPQAGGEAIIRIGDNGDLDVSAVNVEVGFGEGTVAGAELRSLDGTAVPSLPTTVTISDGVDKRFVVYAPAAGSVIVTATEVSAEGLDPASRTVVFGEACVVDVSPDNQSVPAGGTLQFDATTTCDGVVQAFAATPVYTWDIVAAETTGSTVCAGSTISATGLYTAGDAGDCTDTVTATDTANGNVTGATTVNVISCTEAPVVTVTPSSPECVEQEFCAATTLCGEAVEGTYTWSATGGTANTTTGECVPFTPSGTGSFTVTATDTANGGSDTVEGDCVSIDATFTGCGSPFLIWFGVVEIQGTGTDFTLFTPVQYDSLQIVKGIKLTNTTDQIIRQFVLTLPSLGDILFPALSYPTTVTATVQGLSDTFVVPACGVQ